MHSNDQLTGKTSIKSDLLDISRAVLEKLCREDEFEWDNNPYIHRMKELEVKQVKGRVSSFCGPWMEVMRPQSTCDRDSHYAHLMLVTGMDGAEIEMS